MTKEDMIRVKRWLRSIKRTELALVNLQRALDDLETRRQSPPTWMTNLDAVLVIGGETQSKQETWVQFLDAYPARRSFLEDSMTKHNRKLEQYYSTIDQLARDQKWGYLGAEIIKKKYYDGIIPDRTIFTMFLFCTEETFYRAHRRALQFFHDVLPDVFQEKKKVF